MDDSDRNMISREEALVKLKEAVFLTKGKANNDDAMKIAMRKNSTVEDIVRLGTYNKIEPRAYYRPLGGSPRSSFKRSWSDRIQDGRKVMLKDTIVWKFIQQKGMEALANSRNLCNAATVAVRPGGCFYKDYQMIMGFAKSGLDDNILSIPKISENLMKVDHNPVREDHKWSSAFVDFHEGRQKFYDAELEWLAHAPEEVLDLFKDKDGNVGTTYVSMTNCMWNMGGTINSGSETDMTAFKAREYARQMAELMKYMGIGVVGMGGYSWGVVRNRKNTQAMAKYMMQMRNKFMQMIKKGFDVAVVRDEIVSMLDTWASTKCIIKWKFYSRTDAPAEYPDLEAQKKIKKLHHSGSSSPTIVKLSDDEAKTFTIGDKKIVFNRKEAK